MSERLLGAIVGIHGDNKGLVLPPAVAPQQVVIIPIIFKGKEEMVLQTCEIVAEILKSHHLRVLVDKRDITPGNKYYEWELKGVPLRIEIGPRDVQNDQIVVVPRDTSEKLVVSLSDIEIQLPKALDDFNERLYEKAQSILTENMHYVTSIEEAKELKGIVVLPWCGTDACALEVEKILEGNTLGEPLEIDESVKQQRCPVCGSSAIQWMRFARSY